MQCKTTKKPPTGQPHVFLCHNELICHNLRSLGANFCRQRSVENSILFHHHASSKSRIKDPHRLENISSLVWPAHFERNNTQTGISCGIIPQHQSLLLNYCSFFFFLALDTSTTHLCFRCLIMNKPFSLKTGQNFLRPETAVFITSSNHQLNAMISFLVLALFPLQFLNFRPCGNQVCATLPSSSSHCKR